MNAAGAPRASPVAAPFPMDAHAFLLLAFFISASGEIRFIPALVYPNERVHQSTSDAG